MTIEVATYVADLQAANPGASDLRSQGDDHLRLIKAVLQATFPTATKAWYNPTTSSKSANFTVVASDMNKTFLVDPTAGTVTMTLPSLAAGDAGWECFMMKVAGVTPTVLITGAAGTVASGGIGGLTTVRRSIPNARIQCLWTGTSWCISRATNLPLGSLVDFSFASLPVGYEWPNGQTLGSASTLYPEFYAANSSSGVVLDLRGRVTIPLDNLGGSAASRLGSIITGTAVGNVGGAETVALSVANLAVHSHTGTSDAPNISLDHLHSGVLAAGTITSGGFVVGGPSYPGGTTANTGANDRTLSHTHTFTSNNTGSGTAHSNLQPSIMVSKVLVVE